MKKSSRRERPGWREGLFFGLALAVVACLVLAMLAGCSDDETEVSEGVSASSSNSVSFSASSGAPPAGSSAFDATVRGLSRLDQPAALPEPVRVGPAVTNIQGDSYTVEEYFRAAPEFSEIIALDPSTDVIWPGAILNGGSVLIGDCVPVAGKRAPLVFSVSLENIQGNRHATVETPRLSSVRQALGEMLAQNLTGATPARVSFSIETVHDSGQLDLAIGASIGSGGNQIKAQFDFSDSRMRSRVLVRFVQVYYTVDIDLPERPSALFARDADLTAIARGLGAVAPLYVSTISYGRMAFFSFESEADGETLKAAVSASCRGAVADGGASVSLADKTILSNARINATIIGGNGATAVNAVRGFDGLKLHLLAGGNYDKNSPGAPVMYKLRYLSDNTIGRMVLTSEYQVRNVYRLCDWYRVYGMGLVCDSEDDAGSEAEFFGFCDVTLTTNGMPLQGFEAGSPRSGRVWNVSLLEADNWSLAPGGTRTFPAEIRFRVSRFDLAAAVLRVSGWLAEQDAPGFDDMGSREIQLGLAEISGETVWLPAFVEGGTRARMFFKVERVVD